MDNLSALGAVCATTQIVHRLARKQSLANRGVRTKNILEFPSHLQNSPYKLEVVK